MYGAKEVTGPLGDIGVFLTGWLVGTFFLTPNLLAAIILGAGAASLITTGGFASGARLVGGTLWLLGPGGTLVALASEGVAALGSQEREISPEEYNYANQEVFGGTLPAPERIILTDTSGADDRAFVWPRYDGRITVNLGPGGYANPLGSASLLIHELTHAWQLHNTHSVAAFISAGMGGQVCNLVGLDVYALPEPIPTLIIQWRNWIAAAGSAPINDGLPGFQDLTLEQQAKAAQEVVC